MVYHESMQRRLTDSHRSHRQSAFTLVELLVVVGIIAVLIGLLIPTLARAQESARRAACLSNLRQVHHAFAFYALDNKDRVPLGYRAGFKQFNSMVFSKTSGKFCLFGILYQGGYLQEPRTFFCPSETDGRSMQGTDLNPWPPGSDPTLHTYAGYGCRPETELPDEFQALAGLNIPKLSQFKSKAIFADLTATPQRVDTRHKAGVNVLYGDGSAHWVARTAFDADLKQSPALDKATNPAHDAIWADLDRQ